MPGTAMGLPTPSESLDDFSDEQVSEKKCWLSAWHDPLAQIDTHDSCMAFGDVLGDGENRLLIGDTTVRTLKVFKSTTLESQHKLVDIPTAVCVYYVDQTTNSNRRPLVAVAAGASVYLYREMEPYFKFTVPSTPAHQDEELVWSKLSSNKISAVAASKELKQLRIQGVQLTPPSAELVAARGENETSNVVERLKDVSKAHTSSVVCMQTLKMDVDVWNAVSSLVIATEDGKVLILDPLASKVLASVQLPSTAAVICTSGLAKVDYRIVVACRDNTIRTIKNGRLTGIIIPLDGPAVGMLMQGRNIIVALSNSSVRSYHVRGKRNWSLVLPKRITNITPFAQVDKETIPKFLVAMAGGRVCVYQDKVLLSVIECSSPIRALKFGSYARQENTLAMCSMDGAMTIKMLRRTAKLNAAGRTQGPPWEQDVPLKIPKKTKLYVEQTQRERENATAMHRIFQQDLCRLRLRAAKAYLETLTDLSVRPVTYAPGVLGRDLTVDIEVRGLGPYFNLVVEIKNSGSVALTDCVVALSYDQDMYYVPLPLMTIDMILPLSTYVLESGVQCVDEAGGAGEVQMVLSRVDTHGNTGMPLVSAIVAMPLSEEMLVA